MTAANPIATPWEAVLLDASRRAGEIEELRRLPDDLAADLADSGIFRLWVASACGGPEADVQAGLDAIEEAAYHDGSTGWCVMIANTTALMSGKLPAHHARAVFGGRRAVAGGFAIPKGVATIEDGSLRVTGRWAWGSGSSHCTSFGGGVRVRDRSGAPTTLPDGSAAVFAFFDLDEVTFEDTWHAAGLKGTASTDYSVDGALVPEGRWVALDRRQVVVETPLFNYPAMGALALGVAMVSVGLARRAIDELVELADKVPQGSGRRLAERPAVQAVVARAEAAHRSSRAFIGETVAATWEALVATGSADEGHRRALRLAAAHATESCAEAVAACYRAGGGTAVYERSPLQRVFRDVNVVTQHAMVAERILEPIGRMRFGLDTDTRFL